MAGENIVGDAFVRVGLDTGELQDQARAASADIEKALQSGVSDVAVSVTADPSEVQERLAAIRAQLVGLSTEDRAIVLTANIAAFETAISRAKRDLTDLALTPTEIKVRVTEINQATQQVALMKGELQGAGAAADNVVGRSFISKTDAAASGIANMSQALGGVGGEAVNAAQGLIGAGQSMAGMGGAAGMLGTVLPQVGLAIAAVSVGIGLFTLLMDSMGQQSAFTTAEILKMADAEEQGALSGNVWGDSLKALIKDNQDLASALTASGLTLQDINAAAQGGAVGFATWRNKATELVGEFDAVRASSNGTVDAVKKMAAARGIDTGEMFKQLEAAKLVVGTAQDQSEAYTRQIAVLIQRAQLYKGLTDNVDRLSVAAITLGASEKQAQEDYQVWVEANAAGINIIGRSTESLREQLAAMKAAEERSKALQAPWDALAATALETSRQFDAATGGLTFYGEAQAEAAAATAEAGRVTAATNQVVAAGVDARLMSTEAILAGAAALDADAAAAAALKAPYDQMNAILAENARQFDAASGGLTAYGAQQAQNAADQAKQQQVEKATQDLVAHGARVYGLSAEAITTLAAAVDAEEKAMTDAQGSLDDYTKMLTTLGRSLDTLVVGYDGAEAAQSAFASSAQHMVSEAFDVRQAVADSEGGIVDFGKSLRELLPAMTRQGRAFGDARGHLNEYTAAGRDLLDSTQSLAASFQKDLAQTLDNAGGDYDALRARAAVLRAEVTKKMVAARVNPAEIEKYLELLRVSEPTIEVDIKLAQGAQVQDLVDKLLPSVQAEIDKRPALSAALTLAKLSGDVPGQLAAIAATVTKGVDRDPILAKMTLLLPDDQKQAFIDDLAKLDLTPTGPLPVPVTAAPVKLTADQIASLGLDLGLPVALETPVTAETAAATAAFDAWVKQQSTKTITVKVVPDFTQAGGGGGAGTMDFQPARSRSAPARVVQNITAGFGTDRFAVERAVSLANRKLNRLAGIRP